MSSDLKALWKFTCKPNYPVCEGVIIFASKEPLTEQEAKKLAENFAKELGFYYYKEDQTIELLGSGQIINFPSIAYAVVIHAENGEY